jgi:hypothetical protein
VGHADKLSKCHVKNSGREGKHTLFVTCMLSNSTRKIDAGL